jgi:hypothetical protein
MAPQFLLFSPSLTKAMLVPIMITPHRNGGLAFRASTISGPIPWPTAGLRRWWRTEEDQMPVEETGNMLGLLAVPAKV